MKPPRRKKLEPVEISPEQLRQQARARERAEQAALQFDRARDFVAEPRKSSLRTFFDARFRARWWVLVPLCWGLLLGAAALTWHLVR